MKKRNLFAALIFIILFLLFSNVVNGQCVGLLWNTFLGSGSNDVGYGIALDSSGNVYLTGYSGATWGTPVNGHSGGSDAFVLCMDNSGNLLWNTFLGSSGTDQGNNITPDSSGNILVVGWSDATWGSPIHSHSGNSDIFIACMDSSGNLVWNTFLGSTAYDTGYDIALDTSDNIYITGWSDGTWGTPVNAHSGSYDAFAAKLGNNGNLIWNTFVGSTNNDEGYGIALDNSGNIYISGKSSASWGIPMNVHSGGYDAFVAKIGNSGNLVWNTFLGSASFEESFALAFNSLGAVNVTGYSNDTWGSPINAYSGNQDIFVASLDSSGNLVWNTFIGSTDHDCGLNIVSDNSGNVYVTGYSQDTWGSPVNAFSGSDDVFAACLDSTGKLLWNTFLGAVYSDIGYGIGTDSFGNIYITGRSDTSWGSPVNTYSGATDAFVAKLSTHPLADITANGSDGPISITQSDTLQIKVSLISYGMTDKVDFWLAYRGPSGWFHYDFSAKQWLAGLSVTHQGPLMDLNNKKVFQKSGLAPGVYTFYFGVDMNMDGKVTKSSLYKDEVQVTVTQ